MDGKYNAVTAENGCSEDLPYSQHRIPIAKIRRVMFLRKTRRRGRQDARILERRGEQARQRWPPRLASCAVFGRDQFVAGRGVRKAVEVLDDDTGQPRTMALFPEDHCAADAPDASVVQLRLSDMRLCRPRQWAPVAAGQLCKSCNWSSSGGSPAAQPEGTHWDQILQVLVSYRLIAPAASGSCIASGSATAPC